MLVCKACLEEKPDEDFYWKVKGIRRDPSCKACRKEKVRMKFIERKFGITYEDFCEMEREQGGVCAICHQFETHRRGQRLCVDHNHETGEVRGLLCHHCNTGIGLLGDNIATLQNAITYLSK